MLLRYIKRSAVHARDDTAVTNCRFGDVFRGRNVRTDRSCGSLQCVKEHKQNETHRAHSKETVEPADEDDDSRKQK